MTKFISGYTCSTCAWFKQLVHYSTTLGVCDNIDSEHYQHVLVEDHPWCEEWVERVEYELEGEDSMQPLSVKELYYD